MKKKKKWAKTCKKQGWNYHLSSTLNRAEQSYFAHTKKAEVKKKMSKNTFTSCNDFTDQIITFCELFYENFVKALQTN